MEVAREAAAEARRLGADCAVAIGGGSTTGLGKAIALDSGLPIVAIPTTYAGSEGEFNRLSQHLDHGGGSGTTTWMGRGSDGQIGNAIAGSAAGVAA